MSVQSTDSMMVTSLPSQELINKMEAILHILSQLWNEHERKQKWNPLEIKGQKGREQEEGRVVE